MTNKKLLRRHARIQRRMLNRRKRMSPWAIWLVGLPAAALLGGFLHFNGYGPYQELQETLDKEAELKEQIESLEQENESLQEDVDALMPGKFGIEKRAREQLGWSKPGEIVVRLAGKK